MLVFGSVLFWMIVAAVILVDTIFIAFENGWGVSTLSIIALAALDHFFKLGLGTWVSTHVWQLLLYFGLYLIAGTVWSIVKWYFFVLNEADDARERKRYDTAYRPEAPQALGNKARILLWMSYWPISALETIFRDPLRRLFRAIFEQVSAIMQSIADHVFAEFK